MTPATAARTAPNAIVSITVCVATRSSIAVDGAITSALGTTIANT